MEKKFYKFYPKRFIGWSDIARLTVVASDGFYGLEFGEDGFYDAYVVDENAEIGDHYDLVFTAHEWVWIFSDYDLHTINDGDIDVDHHYSDDGKYWQHINHGRAIFDGKTIKVYRAGMMGCIIQIINN